MRGVRRTGKEQVEDVTGLRVNSYRPEKGVFFCLGGVLGIFRREGTESDCSQSGVVVVVEDTRIM